MIFLFLAIYLYILNYQSGQSVKVIENIHLPDISSKVSDYKPPDRCFNPGIFYYNSKIYYVYRIHIGGDFFYSTRLKSEISDKYATKNVIYNPKSKKHRLIDTSEIIALKGFEDPRAIILGNKLYLVVNEMNKITRFREMYLIIIDVSKLSSNIIKPKKIIKLQYNKAELRDQKIGCL